MVRKKLERGAINCPDIQPFIGQMHRALIDTKKHGTEHGFSVCKKNGKLVAQHTCIGDKCSVQFNKCEWGTDYLQFHTHPAGGTLLLSSQDMISAIAEKTKYLCIGTLPTRKSKKAKVRCYRMNYDDDEETIKEVRGLCDAWRSGNHAPFMDINFKMFVGESKFAKPCTDLVFEV